MLPYLICLTGAKIRNNTQTWRPRNIYWFSCCNSNRCFSGFINNKSICYMLRNTKSREKNICPNRKRTLHVRQVGMKRSSESFIPLTINILILDRLDCDCKLARGGISLNRAIACLSHDIRLYAVWCKYSYVTACAREK
jgi:hypothetical protein